ncbi:MAG TPA: DUF4235 domain-containing protein [Solirubrobacteraceae bacterium]|jgi:hypothetical protein|nr:DUF4235 domain-containing protein [Solirubrobacteraceae bacterium]
MSKIIFLPVSIVGGLLASVLSKKLVGAIWGAIDEQEPPKAQHRHVDLGKLTLALAIDGAVFRVVKGLVDHGSRDGFQRLTGSWPGKEAPSPKK